MKIDTSKFFDEVLENIELNNTEPEELNIQPELLEPEDKSMDYDEEVLEKTLAKDFTPIIRKRGEEYYDEGNVLELYKSGNKYIAQVEGSDFSPYDVEIIVEDEYNATYKCTCPYEYPCKHEYAVIEAISNFEYEELDLKPQINKKDIDIKSIIKEIPSEDLKQYILNLDNLKEVVNTMSTFDEYFKAYYPNQKYEYYYNNLYNELILDRDHNYMIKQFINTARQYISNNEFEESFKIVKSIIEAYNDSNKLNFIDHVFEEISQLGIILRISYRKASYELKNEIREWANHLELNNYYNNYYLEDAILSLNIKD